MIKRGEGKKRKCSCHPMETNSNFNCTEFFNRPKNFPSFVKYSSKVYMRQNILHKHASQGIKLDYRFLP